MASVAGVDARGAAGGDAQGAAGGDARSPARAGLAPAALVFALAFALRLALLFAGEDRAWPHSLRYEGDAPVWARWAQALERGAAFEFDLPLRTPGVAFALDALGFTAAPFTAAKVLWCALSAASCSGLWLLVARHASRRAAWIAALWLAASNAALQLATSLNNEALYAALLVALLATHLAEARTKKLALLAGALHGAATLLRAEHLVFVASVASLSLARAWPERAARRAVLVEWGICLAALLAVCAPWAWRSHVAVARFNREAPRIEFARAQPPWTDAARAELEKLPGFAREGNFAFLSHLARQSGLQRVDAQDVRAYFEREWGYTPEKLPEWTLVSSKGALDFALANHPDAGGGFSRAALRDGRDTEPEFSLGRPSHLRLYLHGYSIGLESLRGDPVRARANLGAKFARFLGGIGSGLGADNWPHGPASVRRAVDLSTPAKPSTAWTALAAALCTVGAWLARRTTLGRLLLVAVLYKLAVCAAFYGYARQAASIGPVWCALGALALEPLATRIETHLSTRAPKCSGRVLGALAAVLVLAPAFLALRPTELRPELDPRTSRSAPEWGPGAFEAPSDLRLEPRKSD
jgi:hypothetical protein